MIKEILVSFVHYFVNITTAVLIAAAVFITASGYPMESSILWQILLSGLVTALPTALFMYFEPGSLKASVVYWLVHFLFIFGTTVFLLKTFNWCEINAASVGIIFLAVLFIYGFTAGIHYSSDQKHIKMMNIQLKKRYTDQSEKIRYSDNDK